MGAILSPDRGHDCSLLYDRPLPNFAMMVETSEMTSSHLRCLCIDILTQLRWGIQNPQKSFKSHRRVRFILFSLLETKEFLAIGIGFADHILSACALLHAAPNIFRSVQCTDILPLQTLFVKDRSADLRFDILSKTLSSMVTADGDVVRRRDSV